MSHYTPFTVHNTCSQLTVITGRVYSTRSCRLLFALVTQMSWCLERPVVLLKSPFSYCTFTAFCTNRFSSILRMCPNHLNLLFLMALMMLNVCVREIASWCDVFPVICEMHRALTPLIFAMDSAFRLHDSLS